MRHFGSFGWLEGVLTTPTIAPMGGQQIDAGMMYIDWAIEQGFGVIDANIPEALTGNAVCLARLLTVLGSS